MEESEVAEVAEVNQQGVAAAAGSGGLIEAIAQDMITDSFEEIAFGKDAVDEAQRAWKMLVGMFPNSSACADALYMAIFESAPSLQDLFTTPRAVQAMRFVDAINNYIVNIGDPPALKALVEALAF